MVYFFKGFFSEQGGTLIQKNFNNPEVMITSVDVEDLTIEKCTDNFSVVTGEMILRVGNEAGCLVDVMVNPYGNSFVTASFSPMK